MKFFDSVASHNLERFHSECITWMLNTNQSLLKSFISEISGSNLEEIKFCKAKCEISQIDIAIVYKLGDKWKFIHVENKIKSSEHRVASKKVLKAFNRTEPINQTEFYVLRLNERAKDIIEKLTNLVDKIDYKDLTLDLNKIDNWSFVLLRPSNLMIGNRNIYQISNEWIIRTYGWLLALMEKNPYEGNPIYVEYVNFIRSQFQLDNFNSYYKISKDRACLIGGKNGPTLDLMKRALNWKPNIAQANLVYDHMLHVTQTIEENLKEKMGDNKKNLKVAFVTESGNNPCFLIEAYYEFKKTNFNQYNKNFEDVRIGFQFELPLNKLCRFKFFIAAVNYDKVKFTTQSERKIDYQNRAIDILKESWGYSVLKTIFKTELKQNNNTTKTFLNFAVSLDEEYLTDNTSLVDIFEMAFEPLNEKEISQIEKRLQ